MMTEIITADVLEWAVSYDGEPLCMARWHFKQRVKRLSGVLSAGDS
jgi:hypothetical protein